jgi:hypothetical protein
MSNQELKTAIAHEVQRLHQIAESHATTAKDAAEKAMEAAIQCGQYLDQIDAGPGKLLAWLRDNVPHLTHERARAYLSLFHTHSNRIEHKLDHRAMIQLEIIEVNAMAAKPSTGFAQPKWIGWIGSTRGYFDQLQRERPLDQWAQEEREAVADQLRPLVDLWRKLDGEGEA